MNSSDRPGPQPAGSRKKAYRKPETLSREKLEALAVICNPGKTAGAGGDCNVIVSS